MEGRHRPARQCVGCRSVRPKEDLLRFVKTTSAEAAFDAGSSVQARGFYLCPEMKCFSEAYRNKRTRTLLFRKQEDLKQVMQEVREKILKSIVNDLIRCKKAGYLFDARNEETCISEDAAVLLIHDNPPEEEARNQTCAGSRNALVFRLPETLDECFHDVIVSTRCPMRKRLVSNLQKYEKLSSKGQAL